MKMECENQCRGKPVQILDIVTEAGSEDNVSTMYLRTVELSTICKAGGDRPVILISIAGPSRKGKSFFLSFIIRYLESLEDNNNCESDWIGLNKKNQPLVGFQWGNGYSIQTSGIWIWDQPFIIKNKDERECAVFIVDTQGVFDEETDETDWCRIIGISLLLSSVTILNMSELLENSLKQLNVFIDYGVLVNEQGSPGSSKPFRKLLFLLRDWNNPDEFPYGENGGKKFLEKKLQIEGKPKMSKDSKKVRETISQCFEDLDCFLLPPPGEQAKKLDYDGSLNGVEDLFSIKVAESIESIFCQSKLKILEIGGIEVKSRTLLDYFSKFVEILNKEEKPSSLSLYEATVQISNTNLIERIFEEYQEKLHNIPQNAYGFIPQTQLEELQPSLMLNHLDAYISERQHGNEITWKEYSTKLESNIHKEYLSFVKVNKLHLKDSIKREVINLCEQYKSAVQNNIDAASFLEEDEFEKSSEASIVHFAGIYNKTFQSEDALLVELYKEKLNAKLQGAAKEMNLCNKLAKTSIKDLNKRVNKKYDKIYSTYMSETLSGKAFFSISEIDEAHSNFLAKYADEISAERKGNPAIISTNEEKLEKRLSFKLKEIKQQNFANEKQSTSTIENVLSESMKIFKENLESLNTESGEHILDFFNSIEEIEKDLKQSLNEELDEKFEENRHLFQDKINKYYEKLEKIKYKKIIELESKYKLKIEFKIQTEANNYQQIMERELGNFNKTFISVDDLTSSSKEASNVIADNFEKFVSSLLSPDDSQVYICDLQNKMHSIEEQILAQLEIKFAEANGVAVGFSTEAKSYYQNKMVPYVSEQLPKTEEEFRKIHIMLLAEAKSRFLSNGYTYCEFTNKFLEDIETDAEQIYQHLLELYTMNIAEKVKKQRQVIQTAHLHYSQEMQKHVNGDNFLEPSLLGKFHEKAVEIALKNVKLSHGDQNEEEIKKSLEMLFVIYKDKNNLLMPLLSDTLAIGIDLGTTYTCIGIYIDGKVKIIPYNGKNTTPSCVAFESHDEVYFGEKAKTFKKFEQSVYDVKRLIGLPFTHPNIQKNIKNWHFNVENTNNRPEINILGKLYAPEYISGIFLQELKNSAENYLKDELGIDKPIESAVVAVPAYFTDGQLQATKDAAGIAGLNILRIVPEPTLAAVSYRDLQTKLGKFERFVLVFDLGGGTFDVAVLHVNGNNVDCKAICGDSALGGQDFDQNMVNYCVASFHDKTGIDILEMTNSDDPSVKLKAKHAIQRLRLACEKTKFILSTEESAEVRVDLFDGHTDLKVNITRSMFEEINQDLFDKTIELVEQVIEGASLRKDEIEDIVLVGGSTRIPKIQDMVSKCFNGRALTKTVHKDEAVAHGAAIIAAICNGEIAQETGNFVRCTNTTPRSFGIGRSNGDFSIIIPKGTQIPCQVTNEVYKTSVDYQEAFLIKVYEGECPKALDNSFLGDFTIGGVPPRKAGKEKIYITMVVDSNGILHVKAKSKSSKNELVIIENKCRLNKEAIENYKKLGKGIPVARSMTSVSVGKRGNKPKRNRISLWN